MTTDDLRRVLASLNPSTIQLVGETVIALAFVGGQLAILHVYGSQALPGWLMILSTMVGFAALGRLTVLLRYKILIAKCLKQQPATTDTA